MTRSATPLPVARALADFGDHLRAWRKLNRLTIAQVADRAGVSPDTLTRLESGRGANLENTFRVMRALGTLDSWVEAADPLTTDVGRLRAIGQLPARVRGETVTRR